MRKKDKARKNEKYREGKGKGDIGERNRERRGEREIERRREGKTSCMYPYFIYPYQQFFYTL